MSVPSAAGARLFSDRIAQNIAHFFLHAAAMALGAALLVADWARSTPHNRFDEPPPWQLGQDKVEGAGHCAAPLK